MRATACLVTVPGQSQSTCPRQPSRQDTPCPDDVSVCTADNDWQIVWRIIFDGNLPGASSFTSAPFAHGYEANVLNSHSHTPTASRTFRLGICKQILQKDHRITRAIALVSGLVGDFPRKFDNALLDNTMYV